MIQSAVMRNGAGITALTLGLLIGGCDRDPVAPPNPATQPATILQNATTEPTTKPAKRALSMFIVVQPGQADRAIEFPPAKMIVKTVGDQLRVKLFSDDPRDAIRDDYTGNSFAFELLFDATIDDLPGQEFVFRNSTAERPEDTTGVFLFGGKQTLHPLETAIRIDQDGDRWVAYIGGKFSVWDSDAPDRSTTVVGLRSQLNPEVVIKK